MRIALHNVVWVGIVLAIAAIAQDKSTFHSDTRLVEVEVVVRDGKGPVEGLTQEDFQLFDNGKPQKIGAFSVIQSKGVVFPGTAAKSAPTPAAVASAERAEPPVSATVLFINRFATAFSDQVQVQKRVAEVLHTLPPREPIAVYVLNQSLRIVTDFTVDPARIAKALDAAWGESPQHLFYCGDIPPEYPALEKMANELGSLPGRKNLLWFASSFPVSKPDDFCGPLPYFAMIRALKALNAANVAVYPIAARGVFGPPAYSADRSNAPRIGRNPSQGPSGIDGMYWAHETGGTAAQNTDVGFAALRALDDSQVTYTLGFYPETLDGNYHELKVKVDRKGVDVRSRVGYLASLPVDLSAMVTGSAVPIDSAPGPHATALPGVAAERATMQAPWFYTGTDRARIHLSAEFVPTGVTFQKKGNKLRGQIDVVGTTIRADGGPAAQFEEALNVDFENQEQAEAFVKAQFHYEHELLLLAGNYAVQLAVTTGKGPPQKLVLLLTIEPWHESAFGIGGIAFSTEAREAGSDPAGSPRFVTPLAAAGKEFLPGATNRFAQAEHVYFYTEIYEPSLASPTPASLTLEYRVVDRTSGEVKQDSGMAGVAGYVHPGNSVVPFATTLPVTKLAPGSYRLEVRAGHSSGADRVTRDVDFEIVAGDAAN